MRPILLLMCFLPLCVGCGADHRKDAGERFAGVKVAPPQAAQQPNAAGEFVAHKDEQGPGKDGGGADKKPKADQPRKIRYTADMRLIVEDFAKAEEGLEAAIKDAKGFLKSSETTQVSGNVRSGTWRIRVPVANFNSFRTEVLKLGAVERNTVDSEDLTSQYYDLEEHIKNRNAERDAIRDLLKEMGKQNLKHFLEIKRELDLITDDINRKEGQLKLWANLTDLTTITVHLQEKQKYVGDKKVEEKEIPTFGTRASKVWGDSVGLLGDFVQGLAIVAIAVTPWLPIPLVFLAFFWFLMRRLARSSNAPVVVEVAEEPPSEKK